MISLVFKILKPASSFHGVDYNGRKEQKGQAELLHKANFGVIDMGGRSPSKKELKSFLEYHSLGNRCVRLPQFHAILSCKEHSHSPEQLKEIGCEIMNRLGYSQNPLLMYLHFDTKHRHVHIISSRVDPNGKKISDKFEGLRSNRILMELLGQDAGQNCKHAIDKAFSYRFSTVAQFLLLLELQGYKCRKAGDHVILLKHGNKQGSVNLNAIESHASSWRNNPDDMVKLQARIYKYMRNLDLSLVPQPLKEPGSAVRWESDLTRYLHRTFGMEFIFFSGKNHDRPYGYAVIDHAQRTVYKGGDLIRLSQLIGDVPIKSSIARQVNASEVDHSRVALEKMNSRIPHDPEATLLAITDSLVSDIMRDTEQDLQREEGRSRKRKRKEKGRGV